MPESEEQQPIIIIKKNSGHGGHHGGAWKVAYADFVTAMMAFFLVMWLVTQSQEIKDNVAGYFNDPAGWSKKAGSSILKGGESILDLKNTPKPAPTTADAAREVLKRASERIKEALSRIPDFASIKDLIEIELTPEGLRIQLIEAASSSEDSSHFFNLGSAQLSPKGVQIITLISKELSQLDNKIVIEGHTDSRQYIYQNRYSNWELSADRANSARRLMEAQGIKPEQMFEIRGYADRVPRFEDNPKDARNRRIAILVLNNNAQRNVDTIDLQKAVGDVPKKYNKHSENIH